MKILVTGLVFALLAVSVNADERSAWGQAIQKHLSSTQLSSRDGIFSDRGEDHRTIIYLAVRTDGTLMQVGFSDNPDGGAEESIKGPVGGAEHAVANWAHNASPFPQAPDGLKEGVYVFAQPMRYFQLRDFSTGGD